MVIKWAKLDKSAVVPTVATDGSAGWDIVTPRDVEIPPQSQVIIGTGIACEIPPGWVGLIRGRSGFSRKTGTITADDYIIERRALRNAGAIDSDYRGEIGVMLSNYTPEPVNLVAGQAFAQMIVVPCLTQGVEVHPDDLDITARGSNGYGSTRA